MYPPVWLFLIPPVVLVVCFFWGSSVARMGNKPLGLAITLTPVAALVLLIGWAAAT